MYQGHKLWIKRQSSLHFFPFHGPPGILLMLTWLKPLKHSAPPPSIKSTVSAILTGTAPLNHLRPSPLLLAFVVNWKMTDSLHLHSASECVTIRAQDFPTIVRALSDRKSNSRHSLCGKLDHLLAGTISHCDQSLHVELLLTQDQETLLPWKYKQQIEAGCC